MRHYCDLTPTSGCRMRFALCNNTWQPISIIRWASGQWRRLSQFWLTRILIAIPCCFHSALVVPQTQCTLTLFNMTEENIIIAARLPHDGKQKDIELLRREKVCIIFIVFLLVLLLSFALTTTRSSWINPLEHCYLLSVWLQDECTAILKTISHHINTEHNELQSHRLLSIFKMSEVDVVWPESTSAARSGHGHGQQTAASRLLSLLLLSLAVTVRGTLRMSNVLATWHSS